VEFSRVVHNYIAWKVVFYAAKNLDDRFPNMMQVRSTYICTIMLVVLLVSLKSFFDIK